MTSTAPSRTTNSLLPFSFKKSEEQVALQKLKETKARRMAAEATAKKVLERQLKDKKNAARANKQQKAKVDRASNRSEKSASSNFLPAFTTMNFFEGGENPKMEKGTVASRSLLGAKRNIKDKEPMKEESSLFHWFKLVVEKNDESIAVEAHPAGPKAAQSSFLGLWNANERVNNKIVKIKHQVKQTGHDKHKTIGTKQLATNIVINRAPERSSTKENRPSVYEEAMAMLAAALLIYTFADLRKMAREGEITSKVLEMDPVSIGAVIEAIHTHRKALQRRAKIDENDMDARLKTLKDIQVQQSRPSTVVGRLLRGAINKETVLTRFHDEKSTRGMVYGIAVNPIQRRVTIIFRGSVTRQDFVTDAKLSQKVIANPVIRLGKYCSQDLPQTINVHTGFYDYLFQKDDEGRVRLDHILEDAKKLLKKNPGYRLFCTGHSLGGALATLFGFYAALDEEAVKIGPVSIYSIASPRVGNTDFRRAFQCLERTKRLQHLRITNREDIVTHVPFVTMEQVTLSPTSLLSQTTTGAVNLYAHCGIHLKLKSERSGEDKSDPMHLFSLTYAKDKNDEDNGFVPEELRRSLGASKSMIGSLLATKANFQNITKFHSCHQYERLLLASREQLAQQTLDHLYADSGTVGPAVAWRNESEKKIKASSIHFFPTDNSPKHRTFV